MKQPKLSQLKIEKAGTKQIRAQLAKKNSVKITINIDADSVVALKRIAKETQVPYQRLLNALLKDGLTRKEATESRLDRLERELKQVKRKLVA